jgi:hypothetical protein
MDEVINESHTVSSQTLRESNSAGNFGNFVEKKVHFEIVSSFLDIVKLRVQVFRFSHLPFVRFSVFTRQDLPEFFLQCFLGKTGESCHVNTEK